MRKIKEVTAVAFPALVLLTLIICTLVGDKLYEKWVPEVLVCKSKAHLENDDIVFLIPKASINNDNVLVYVSAEQGVSRVIYRIHRTKAEIVGYDEITEEYSVKADIPTHCYVALYPEKLVKFKDGQKVIFKEQKEEK